MAEKKLPAKPKGKPRGGNSPVIGDNGLMLQEGDNAKFLAVNIKLFNMQNIDMTDVEAVAQRLSDYFQLYVLLNPSNKFFLRNDHAIADFQNREA